MHGGGPAMLPHRPPPPSQRATLKYFIIVSLLFLMQVLVGGGVAHFRADAASFYGIDISRVFPSQLLRTWHLQLAILWIATAFLSGRPVYRAVTRWRASPHYQSFGVNLLFVALIVVVTGSLLGECARYSGRCSGQLWEWFGYLGLGISRSRQGLADRARRRPCDLGSASLSRGSGLRSAILMAQTLGALLPLRCPAIPVFYLPAFFYNSSTNFAIVDHWRFWIIHLWVEDFFELFRYCGGRRAVLPARCRHGRHRQTALSISMRFYTLWAASSARPIIGISRVNRA